MNGRNTYKINKKFTFKTQKVDTIILTNKEERFT
jgi:hypothetical protein